MLHKMWLFGTQQISSKEGHTNDGLGPWGCMNLILESSWWSSWFFIAVYSITGFIFIWKGKSGSYFLIFTTIFHSNGILTKSYEFMITPSTWNCLWKSIFWRFLCFSQLMFCDKNKFNTLNVFFCSTETCHVIWEFENYEYTER